MQEISNLKKEVKRTPAPIITDPKKLKEKSKPCFFHSLDILVNQTIAQELIDTALFHQDKCLALAANQIGYNKRICIISVEAHFLLMVNPVVLGLKTQGIKVWYENCLSYPDHKTGIASRRFKKVKVQYQIITGKTYQVELQGLEAAAIQHCIDHFNGKLI